LRLESKEEAVERSLEQSLWVVLDSGSLHGRKRRVATVGQRGLPCLTTVFWDAAHNWLDHLLAGRSRFRETVIGFR
jgi:hypothetical protein